VGVVLDSGALIAFERGDRGVAALLEAARRRRDRVVTSSGCVAQAWRGGGPRQALLARLLRGVREHGLDRAVSRPVGTLCAEAGATDVIDGHVALLAHDHDVVLTGDVNDIVALLRVRGCDAHVRPC
jgi:hypothetical protein